MPDVSELPAVGLQFWIAFCHRPFSLFLISQLNSNSSFHLKPWQFHACARISCALLSDRIRLTWTAGIFAFLSSLYREKHKQTDSNDNAAVVISSENALASISVVFISRRTAGVRRIQRFVVCCIGSRIQRIESSSVSLTNRPDFVYTTFDNTEGLVFSGSAATSSCVPVPAVGQRYLLQASLLLLAMMRAW